MRGRGSPGAWWSGYGTKLQHLIRRTHTVLTYINATFRGMDERLERAGAWCGIATMVTIGVTLVAIGRLIPPFSPTDNAARITHIIIDHKIRIRVGVALSLVGFALTIPLVAALSMRLRRIEGQLGVLSLIQIIGGVFLPIATIIPLMLLTVATYRPEQRPPEITQAFSDAFWLMFVGTVGPIFMQCTALAIGAFIDRNDPRVFPRWFGYLNVWCAVLFLPGGAVVLFNDGPLAWNGVFAFWIPVVVFFVWMTALSVVTLRSIGAQLPGVKFPV